MTTPPPDSNDNFTFHHYYSLLSQASILLLYDILKSPNDNNSEQTQNNRNSFFHISHQPADETQSSQNPPDLSLNIQPWMTLSWIHPYFHERQQQYIFAKGHHFLFQGYFYWNGMKRELERMGMKAQSTHYAGTKKKHQSHTSRHREMSSESDSHQDSSFQHQSQLDSYFTALKLCQQHIFTDIYGDTEYWRYLEAVLASTTSDSLLKSKDMLVHLLYLYSINHVNLLILVLLSEKELKRDEVTDYKSVMRQASYLFYIVTEVRKRRWDLRKQCGRQYSKIVNSEDGPNPLHLMLLEIYVQKILLPAHMEALYWDTILRQFLIKFSQFSEHFHSHTQRRMSKQGQTKNSLCNEIMMWLSKEQVQALKRRSKRIRRKKTRYSDLNLVPENVAEIVAKRQHVPKQNDTVFNQDTNSSPASKDNSIQSIVVDSFLKDTRPGKTPAASNESKL